MAGQTAAFAQSSMNWKDILFVLIAPPLCFWFDPLLTRQSIIDLHALLSEPTGYALYVLVAVCMIAFVTSYTRYHGPLVMGVLALGFALSSVLGAIFLPFVLISLGFTFPVPIGLVGLLPLATAWRIYQRIDWEQFKQMPIHKLVLGIVAPLLLAAPIYLIVHFKQAELLRRLESAPSEEVKSRLAEYLDSWACGDTCPLVAADLGRRGQLQVPKKKVFEMMFEILGRRFEIVNPCMEPDDMC